MVLQYSVTLHTSYGLTIHVILPGNRNTETYLSTLIITCALSHMLLFNKCSSLFALFVSHQVDLFPHVRLLMAECQKCF